MNFGNIDNYLYICNVNSWWSLTSVKLSGVIFYRPYYFPQKLFPLSIKESPFIATLSPLFRILSKQIIKQIKQHSKVFKDI